MAMANLIISLPSWTASLSTFLILVTVLYWIYLQGFPKPIPGIPMNPGTINRFMGDIGMWGEKSPRDWLGDLGNLNNAPLVQVFLGPYKQPLLILFDYWEAHDICLRRTKEFDKSDRQRNIFASTVPNHRVTMKTSDPQFRENKELVKDLMTPSFLNEISAPEIYKRAISLVHLWSRKSEAAEGRPFAAFRSIWAFAFDTIMAASFGQSDEASVLESQIRRFSNTNFEVPVSRDLPIEFPEAPLAPEYEAISKVSDSIGIPMKATFQNQTMWFYKTFTKLRTYYKTKDSFLDKKMLESARKVKDSDKNVKSALDHLIMREIQAAEKGGRAPSLNSPTIRDEVMGYIIAGHESSAATTAWVVKYLTDNPRVTHTLRNHLHAIYTQAQKQNRRPTVDEITKLNAPYLDAFLEESFRRAPTLPLSMRETTTDTRILGHWVPKNTTVWFYNHGPCFNLQAINRDNAVRSSGAQGDRERVDAWTENDISVFKPERWLRPRHGAGKTRLLVTTEMKDYKFGDFEFNPNAGPMMTFGSGPRGCCGRRLAYLQLRILVALLVWEFEFESCPHELSSYDKIHAVGAVPRHCFLRLRRAS